MSQGLFTAVSGIAVNQSKIDVISDNIANMNTVAFKANQVNFENVYVRTLTAGNAPGVNIGGTNPMQIGLGTTVGEISRNFTSGTVQSTGRPSDLNIQGTGFFTLFDGDGALVLTRAGNFTLDSDGYLVNAQGLKAIGTDATTSITGSNTPIKIPQGLNLVTTNATLAATDMLANIDSTNITPGFFTVTVGGVDTQIPVTATSTAQDIITAINAIDPGLTASLTASGEFELTYDTALTGPVTIGDPAADTSNFINATQLTTDVVVGTVHTLTGTALNANSVDIRPEDGTSTSYPLIAFSIGKDGSIEATYSNGDKLTVTGEPTRELLYKTTTGREIVGTGIEVFSNAVAANQLQLQLANVINPKGLVSQAGNIFTVGPNAGYATFAIGKYGGMGGVQSGGLESSNVDLPSEFSNMILAQRGIDANSRTFDAINQIMRTIVNMGR